MHCGNKNFIRIVVISRYGEKFTLVNFPVVSDVATWKKLDLY